MTVPPAAPQPMAAAPAPGYQPPPPAGAFAPAKPKMKLWKKIAIGVALFIVAIVGLSMWATSDLDQPVKAHFASLKAGDVDGAYAELSVAARHATSVDDFKAMLKSVPSLTHVTGMSFTSRTVENGQGKLEGTLELEGGGKLPVDILLVKENERWKIFAYKTHDLKSGE